MLFIGPSCHRTKYKKQLALYQAKCNALTAVLATVYAAEAASATFCILISLGTYISKQRLVLFSVGGAFLVLSAISFTVQSVVWAVSTATVSMDLIRICGRNCFYVAFFLPSMFFFQVSGSFPRTRSQVMRSYIRRNVAFLTTVLLWTTLDAHSASVWPTSVALFSCRAVLYVLFTGASLTVGWRRLSNSGVDLKTESALVMRTELCSKIGKLAAVGSAVVVLPWRPPTCQIRSGSR